MTTGEAVPVFIPLCGCWTEKGETLSNRISLAVFLLSLALCFGKIVIGANYRRATPSNIWQQIILAINRVVLLNRYVIEDKRS